MSRHLTKHVRRMRDAFLSEDTQALRYQSNALMRKASLTFDRSLARLAMTAYCLHKLLTKEHVVTSPRWPRHRTVLAARLEKMLLATEKSGRRGLMDAAEHFARELWAFDRQAGRYVQSLWDKATIKYAADAYFLGVSLGRAAQLTGATRSNLQEFVGATEQKEAELPEKGIARRLAALEEAL